MHPGLYDLLMPPLCCLVCMEGESLMSSMLTTVDNPFNPFKDWDKWFQFDEEKGYHSCQYLARIAKTSADLSDSDYEREVDRAIDEILELNVLGIYKKVTSD